MSSFRAVEPRGHLEARLGHGWCTHAGFLAQSPLNALPMRGCQVALTVFFLKKKTIT